MTPDGLLAAADQLLASTVPQARGRWPRACAWLIRLALERALDDYWVRKQPEAARCPMRAQLLLLPSYVDVELALMTRDAWTNLARAGHHHAYELAPTAAELRSWHGVVVGVVGDLSAA